MKSAGLLRFARWMLLAVVAPAAWAQDSGGERRRPGTAATRRDDGCGWCERDSGGAGSDYGWCPGVAAARCECRRAVTKAAGRQE